MDKRSARTDPGRVDAASPPEPPSSPGFARSFAWPLPIQAVYLLAPPFVLVVAVLLSPITPHDYFWALVQGRTIGQLGTLPRQNLFLFTLPAEAPFFNQPWLAQLIMYRAATWLGHGANVAILAGALCMAMVAAMDRGLRRGLGARPVAVAALLATPFLAMAAGVRTQMFAFPCFALVAHLVFAGRAGNGRLVALFVVVAAWTNLHGSFVLAPVLAALAAAGHRQLRIGRRLALVGATVLGTGVHPAGPAVWGYALSLSNAMGIAGRSAVEEWRRLPLATPLGVGYVVCVALYLGWAIRARARFPWRVAVPFLCFVAAGLASQRFVPFAALLAPLALPGSEPAPRVTPSRREGWIHAGFLAAFALLALACVPGLPLFEARAAGRSPRDRMFERDLPLGLVAELARRRTGRVFHPQAVGGLVEWMLAADGPRPVAFVDQRFEIIPASVWDEYGRARNALPGWEEVFARYGITSVLAETQEAGGLLASLPGDGRWRCVGVEGTYSLWMRNP